MRFSLKSIIQTTNTFPQTIFTASKARTVSAPQTRTNCLYKRFNAPWPGVEEPIKSTRLCGHVPRRGQLRDG